MYLDGSEMTYKFTFSTFFLSPFEEGTFTAEQWGGFKPAAQGVVVENDILFTVRGSRRRLGTCLDTVWTASMRVNRAITRPDYALSVPMTVRRGPTEDVPERFHGAFSPGMVARRKKSNKI